MKKLSILLLLGISVLSCKKEHTETDTTIQNDLILTESSKVNTFFDKQFNDYVSRHPETQTSLGIKTDYGKWDDISSKAKEFELNETKKALQWLKDSVNISLLDKSTLISYKLYKEDLEHKISDYKYKAYKYPVNQMHGMQAEIPAFLINMHSIDNTKDAEDYISRLEGMDELFNHLIDNLKASETAGIVIPKFVFTHVINDSKNVIKGFPFDESTNMSTLYDDFKSKVVKLNIAADRSDDLFMKAEAALKNHVQPAYNHLIDFLTEQQKRATTDDGVWKFPNGAEFYNNALQRTTTTTLTADEIHELGLAEVKRIHEEMTAIKEKVGFEGDLQAFFKFMKTDKQFYYASTPEGKNEYMVKATRIIDSMKTRLDELFITKPKADLKVKAVEAFREQSAGKAFYQGPSQDGKRPGTYYANMYDMEAMPTYQMEALAYHEGIPGHHMQISIARELTEVPQFRKFGGYTAYIEGWGLYSEFIPKEMGFYSDPYSDFGRLAMELWRSCRLVVDTGIHAKRWTRQDGIDYYKNNTPNALTHCVKMVERHIVMPSQATAYKVGMNKILDIREGSKERLGDKFDIREFHEVVLTNGALPLTVLEELVKEWEATK